MKSGSVQEHVAVIARRKQCVSNFSDDPLISINIAEACIITITSPLTINDSAVVDTEANVTPVVLSVTFCLLSHFVSYLG